MSNEALTATVRHEHYALARKKVVRPKVREPETAEPGSRTFLAHEPRMQALALSVPARVLCVSPRQRHQKTPSGGQQVRPATQDGYRKSVSLVRAA